MGVGSQYGSWELELFPCLELALANTGYTHWRHVTSFGRFCALFLGGDPVPFPLGGNPLPGGAIADNSLPGGGA
jgi:hypothetical protein